MKKLLSVFTTAEVFASSTVSVVACSAKSENKSENPENLNYIVKDFQKEVTKIWSDHYEKEVASNLITLEDWNNDYKFLNKENINKFSKLEDKLTFEHKKQLTSDIEKLFQTKLLKQKLNELKKFNNYKVILDDVESVFDGLEIIYNDNFKINSGEIVEGVYIGNFINEYKINIKYKGKNDIEKFELRDILKFTLTESKLFKDAGDNLIKNIEKDFLVSNEMKKYSNFEWKNIKRNKKTYEGYDAFFEEIKNHINSSNEYKNNLINFIKHNYFKSFKNLNINFNQNNIYIDSVFKTNLLNVFDNKNIKYFENYTDSEKNSEKIFKIIFRNDPDSELNKESLKNLYFTNKNMNKWNSELFTLKNNYLKNLKPTNQQINLIEKSNEYISADSIGNIKLKGANIIIGSGDNKYVHELSNFKLSVTYNVSSKVEEKIDFLSDFTSKGLIKIMHNFYGIDSSFKYPEFNSDEDYLMNIGNKKIISNIKDTIDEYYFFTDSLNKLFISLWVGISDQNKKEFFNSTKLPSLISNSIMPFFLYSNYSNNLQYIHEDNDKMYFTFNNQNISFIIQTQWKKYKNPDSFTFKLGYLTVNFKYEKLFNLSKNQKSKIFIKFI